MRALRRVGPPRTERTSKARGRGGAGDERGRRQSHHDGLSGPS